MTQFTVTHTNKANVQALPRSDVNIPQQKATVAFEHKLARHSFHTQCYTETCASAKHHRLFIMEMLAATRTHLQSVGQLTPELSKKMKLKALQIRRAIERNDPNDTYLKDLSDIRSWRSFQCKE